MLDGHFWKSYWKNAGNRVNRAFEANTDKERRIYCEGKIVS